MFLSAHMGMFSYEAALPRLSFEVGTSVDDKFDSDELWNGVTIATGLQRLAVCVLVAAVGWRRVANGPASSQVSASTKWRAHHHGDTSPRSPVSGEH